MALTNVHHAIWCRKSYQTPTERSFRNHKGLVIPIDTAIHGDLHADLNPFRKPPARLIVGALDFLDKLPDTALNDPMTTVEALSEHFYHQSSKVAEGVGQNLARQLVYIEEGIVR